jgi:tRNA threonylcarbamoyladenosine biosynthesis protein TsaB
MNLLAIDTSTQNTLLAIRWDNKLILNINRQVKFGASHIIIYLEKAVKQRKIDLKKLDAIVVGAGPGSFTGLRIGFSVVKALSIGLDKPVISLSSFFTIAYGFKNKNKYSKIAVVADARRNLIYGACFGVKQDKLIQTQKEKLFVLEEFVKAKQDHFFISSDDHIRIKALEINPEINFFSKVVYPQAKTLLNIANTYYQEKEFTAINKLEPLYVHPKTCQIRKVV